MLVISEWQNCKLALICHTKCELGDVGILSRSVCQKFLKGIVSDFRDSSFSSFAELEGTDITAPSVDLGRG